MSRGQFSCRRSEHGVEVKWSAREVPVPSTVHGGMKRVESTGTIPSINENTKIDVRRWARRFDKAKTSTSLATAEIHGVTNEALVDDSEEETPPPQPSTMPAMEEAEPVYSSPRNKQQVPAGPPPAPPLPQNGVKRVSVCSEDYSSESSGNGNLVDHAVLRTNSMSPVHRMEHREHSFLPNNYRYHVPTLTKPTPPPADKGMGKKKLSTVQLIPEEFYAAQALG